MEDAARSSELRRTLGFGALTVYAVGDILGAGIYALVGQVASVAGPGAWLSFGVAALVALFTGLTYAELSSRFPYAAGAAAYVRRGVGAPRLAFVVGLFVLASGLTSAATVSLAFLGYLAPFVEIPAAAGSIALLGAMSVLSFWGMRESSQVNMLLTGVEIGGLLIVLAGAAIYLGDVGVGEAVARVTPPTDFAAVVGGATIAFFAFIGFEDTANVAEEVRDPGRVLPRAILTALAITTTLYVAVTVCALAAVPAAELAASEAPLLAVLEVAGIQLPGGLFSLIALFAICNTGLLNLIMASRLAYGMAREGLLPASVARVHPTRRTPWVGVVLAFAMAALLALSGGVKVLAQTTSLLLLSVFATLHVVLLRLKLGGGEDVRPEFSTPAWTPAVGLALSVGLLVRYPGEVYLRGFFLLGFALVLFALLAPRSRSMS